MVSENEYKKYEEKFDAAGSVIKTGVGITSVICPPLGATIAATFGVANLAANAIGVLSDDSDTKKLAKLFSKLF